MLHDLVPAGFVVDPGDIVFIGITGVGIVFHYYADIDIPLPYIWNCTPCRPSVVAFEEEMDSVDARCRCGGDGDGRPPDEHSEQNMIPR